MRLFYLFLAVVFWSPTMMACEASVYSSSTKQVSFPTVAVETYKPYTNQPDGQYMLCYAKEGSILVSSQPGGYKDFYFPYNQQLECKEQITATDNCYPTYSAIHRTLDFPKIEMPLKAILPFMTIEMGTICYHVTLEQSAIQSGNFMLVNAEEIACD